jgi:excisionase family DNA binding protein
MPMSNGVIADVAPVARPLGLASVDEATKYLSISRSALYSLMDRGELPYIKLGKSRRISWAALHEMIAKHTIGQ